MAYGITKKKKRKCKKPKIKYDNGKATLNKDVLVPKGYTPPPGTI